jgi:hypothetical protein
MLVLVAVRTHDAQHQGKESSNSHDLSDPEEEAPLHDLESEVRHVLTKAPAES